jgi:FkbM family methyltransferase
MQTEVVQTQSGTFETFSGDLLTAQLRGGHESVSPALPLIKRGDVVIDVGAHVGTSSIPFAQAGARVIAFEPVAATFELLERNVARNEADVTCVNALVSDAPVSMRATQDAGNTQATYFEPGESELPTVVLDDYHDGPLALLKVDVEGMELSVLRGAQRLLRDHRPIVVFEVNRRHLRRVGTRTAELDAFFRERGYHLFLEAGDGLGRLDSLRMLRLGGTSLGNLDVVAIHPDGERHPSSSRRGAVGVHIADAAWRALKRRIRKRGRT